MKWWPSVALLGLWVGCDAQAGGPYQGEPLLTMTGSVELALEVENESELIPTLAFEVADQTVHLVETDVAGEFPAEFTLNVYQPPPQEAVYELEPELGPGPRVAVGYIGAVRPDTPATFRLSSDEGGNQGCRRDDVTGLNVCSETHTWCTTDGSDCYVERTVCPDSDNHPEECTVTSEGDPELKLGLEERFAGLSENYIVLWLEAPAPPRSYIAYVVGERDRGLAQGYHLFSITDVPDMSEAEQAADICLDEARALAVQRTNERHGTTYNEEELSSLCTFDDCPQRDTEIYATYEAAQHAAQIELDCPPDDEIIARVNDPASERISVRIGPDLKGF